jgi:WD40 repeat protein
MSIAFSSDGRTLASGHFNNTVLVWDLTDHNQPRRLGQPLSGHTGFVSSVAFASNRLILASGSADSTTMLWDLTNLGLPTALDKR